MGAILGSCNNDPQVYNEPFLENTAYDSEEESEPGASGDVLSIKQEEAKVQHVVEVENTSAGNMHPAHVQLNAALGGGDVKVPLEPLGSSTGLNTTSFLSLEESKPIIFENIATLDAYINVHLSADDLDTIVAQGDIGQNEITEEFKSFDFNKKVVDDTSGSLLTGKRLNDEALATLSFDYTPSGRSHPAHIHENATVEGGGILSSFTPVVGDAAMSQSHVETLDGDTTFGYEDPMGVDGYMNVSLDDSGTNVAQIDIDRNEGAANFVTYDLDEQVVDDTSGSLLIEERLNDEVLTTLSFDNTPADGLHPTHTYENTAKDREAVHFSFIPVVGDTGMSQPYVEQLDDTTLGHANVMEVEGYVNVYLSLTD